MRLGANRLDLALEEVDRGLERRHADRGSTDLGGAEVRSSRDELDGNEPETRAVVPSSNVATSSISTVRSCALAGSCTIAQKPLR